MPNHRIAKGIQAKGERLRKKLTNGKNAERAQRLRPSQTPAGALNAVAKRNPVSTRYNEAIKSLSNLPLAISWRKPWKTASGAGNSDSGQARHAATPAHSAKTTPKASQGRAIDAVKRFISNGFAWLSEDMINMPKHNANVLCGTFALCFLFNCAHLWAAFATNWKSRFV